MSSIKHLFAVVVICALVACGSNAPPPPTEEQKAQAAAQAKAALEAKAAKDVALYDQMRASQSWDLAGSLGDEIVRKYPGSAAATQLKQTLDDVHAKATAQRESRRLARLWAYAAIPEGSGTQYTAAVESKEPLKTPSPRVRLVLRQHPQWGQSVYLLLDNAKFDCSKGCATLPVRFDDAPAQRMKATIPPTGEPALFIDDDKGFIAKMVRAKTVAIDATIKGDGPKTLVFEVGGYDATKLPGVSKK
jgi:hypothetical protein